MDTYYQIPCPFCCELNDLNDNICNHCGGTFSDPINVRRASLPIETKALNERYAKAKEYLLNNGLEAEGNFIEKEVQSKGKAVINTSSNFLWEWLFHNKGPYESYRRQLINGSRQRAKFRNDSARSVADSFLFGSEQDIVYSAFSIEELGIISYGQITLVLKTSSIEKRTSALEKNSYHFINDIMAKGWAIDHPLPPGYMCIWPTNFKLTLSKLCVLIKKNINFNQLSNLVLNSTGDRANDEFIELYIYGKIISSVIEKIKIPLTFAKTFSPKETLMLKELQSKYSVELY